MEYPIIQDFQSFLLNIDWTEPWILALIIFHMFNLFMVIGLRNRPAFQIPHFFSLLFLVACAEKLNEIAARNWSLFSKEQYFDSNGMFISVVLAMPLCFCSLFIIINWLYQASQLLIVAKRKELVNTRNVKVKEG